MLIKLKSLCASPEIMARLEKKNLIKTLKPTAKVLNSKTKTGAVDILSSASVRHGGHKLICVGKRSTEIRLSYHPAGEEFIITGGAPLKFKPLFLIVALQKRKLLEKKIRENKLSGKDFIALRLKYNDFKTSIFTMLKDTVHCEVTLPGKGMHPVFYVSEPGRLKSININMRDFNLAVAI